MNETRPDCPSALLDEAAGPSCSPARECPNPAPTPHQLIFQWHITERCNLRCTHCYQETYGGDELHFAQWLGVIAQLGALLTDWAATSPVTPRIHLNLTGGEPFLHQDFLRLLHVLRSKRDRLSFAILCNGSFIDARMAKTLAALAPRFVQVSIEG